jgi:hypothetical protein
LTSVTIGNAVATIGEQAFYKNQLTSVTIPGSVKTIEYGAFANNELASVTILGSGTAIQPLSFANNPLTSVTLSAGVSLVKRNTDNGVQRPFPGNLDEVYASGGAGTYTRNGTSSTTWAKQ